MSSKTTVENYIESHTRWSEVLKSLRILLQESGMTETIKWGMPVYSLDGANIAGIVALKGYVALWFYQGVFLQDNSKVLQNPLGGKTKALRQWRFKSLEEIDGPIIQDYLAEAMQNQKEGKQVKRSKVDKVTIPIALGKRISEDHALQQSFNKLSLSKQNVYAEYIKEAKKEETKQKRLEKIIPMILQGIGLNDQYKK